MTNETVYFSILAIFHPKLFQGLQQEPIALPHDQPSSDLYPQVSRKYLAFEISHCVVPAHSCIPTQQYTVPLCFL